MNADFLKARPDIGTVIKGLQKNHMQGYYAGSREELFQLLLKFIPDNTTVGCGDSVTLEDLGVFAWLRKREIRFLDKFEPSLSREEKTGDLPEELLCGYVYNRNQCGDSRWKII